MQSITTTEFNRFVTTAFCRPWSRMRGMVEVLPPEPLNPITKINWKNQSRSTAALAKHLQNAYQTICHPFNRKGSYPLKEQEPLP